MFALIDTPRHRLLQSDLLHLPGLFAGFTTRQRREHPGAPWASDWTFRSPRSLEHSAGYQEFIETLLPPGMATAVERQVHSTTVTVAEPPWGAHHPHVVAEASDALLTQAPGIACLSQSADCCVGLVVDPVTRAVGAFHAGWRGAVAGMPGTCIGTMVRCYGTDPADLRIALGPTIQQRSYQVGPEVAEAVQWAEPEYAYALCPADPGSPGRFRLDLQGLVHLLLQRAGVPGEQIDRCPHDTFAQADLLHSFRRDGSGQGLQVGFIGWMPH
ncbi:MAG TPA: polyphenol oxidase family protein [bacterium]|nr:polyphenol oxidase family protein [bacterium]